MHWRLLISILISIVFCGSQGRDAIGKLHSCPSGAYHSKTVYVTKEYKNPACGEWKQVTIVPIPNPIYQRACTWEVSTTCKETHVCYWSRWECYVTGWNGFLTRVYNKGPELSVETKVQTKAALYGPPDPDLPSPFTDGGAAWSCPINEYINEFRKKMPYDEDECYSGNFPKAFLEAYSAMTIPSVEDSIIFADFLGLLGEGYLMAANSFSTIASEIADIPDSPPIVDQVGHDFNSLGIAMDGAGISLMSGSPSSEPFDSLRVSLLDLASTFRLFYSPIYYYHIAEELESAAVYIDTMIEILNEGLPPEKGLTFIATSDSLRISFGDVGEIFFHAFSDVNISSASCPILFVWDGANFVEENTILTSSEDAVQGEVVTDFYKFQKPLTAQNNNYHLQIRELEKEKSFIDQVELITIDYPESSRIGITTEGEILILQGSIPPIAALNNKGVDYLDQVKVADGNIYESKKPGSLTLTYSLPEKYSGDVVENGMITVMRNLIQHDHNPCHHTDNYILRSLPEEKNIPKDVRIEIQDKNAIWHELPAAPPRKSLTENFWLINSNDFELAKEFKVRISWNNEYSADELRYFFVSNKQPNIKSLYLISAYHSKNGRINQLLSDSDDNFVTLINGEILDLYFSAESEPIPDGMKSDFVLKTVGYYVIRDDEQFTSYSDKVVLYNNFPNPANPSTEISYFLPRDCNVQLSIFNVLGQRVRTLVDDDQKAGNHAAQWDGKNEIGSEVASGVYFYRLKVGDFNETKKMLLLK